MEGSGYFGWIVSINKKLFMSVPYLETVIVRFVDDEDGSCTLIDIYFSVLHFLLLFIIARFFVIFVYIIHIYIDD